MISRNRRSDEPDATDLRILSALQEDGRLTVQALAEKVGLSPSPCWTRVKRLEESGAIEKYVAVLDQKALGFGNVVFVEITLDKHDDKILDHFGEALTRIPEVVEAYLVTGEYDYLVKVVVSASCARCSTASPASGRRARPSACARSSARSRSTR